MGVRMLSMAIALAAILLGMALTAWGQETPSETVEMEGIGGGGPMVSWLFLDLTALNGVLAANGYAPLEGGLLLLGGGGGGGRVRGLRFGGLGGGGQISSTAREKRAALSVGFGGVLLSYGLATAQSYDLSVGALIGGGGATLTLTDHRPTDFQDAVARPTSTVLNRGFFALLPRASVSLPVFSWLSLRVSAGYLVTLGGGWEQQGAPLPGPPASMSAWTVQATVEFGGRGGGEVQED